LPLYQYDCPSCGSMELFHSWQEAGQPRACPDCASPLTRVYTVPATQQGIDWDSLDPKEKEFHLAHKKAIEKRAKDVVDGTLEIKVPKKCPEQAKPHIPVERKHF